jgi:release factor glutamine methyltransferase
MTDATIGEACCSLAAAFRKAGIDTAALDARLIVAAATGLSQEAIIARGGETLNAEQSLLLEEMRRRRIGREPVSRIIGSRDFWGLRFTLNAATLDPRPDSEALVETALNIVKAEGWSQAPLRILDLGTGSGCLLLALLSELPSATGVGTDIAALALDAARENASRLGLADRADFIAADWLDGVKGTFDLVVSNPPYVPMPMIAALPPEVRCDPVLALDGGESGLDAYRRIVPGLTGAIREGGWVVLEIGPGQAESVWQLLHEAGFRAGAAAPRVYCDLAGRERGVAGKRQG